MIDLKIQKEAVTFVKKNIKIFIDKFANPQYFLPVEEPFSIFMAGSPGAGKTEFSNSFNPNIIGSDSTVPIVTIDPDEIKKDVPQYNGKNTDSVQKAATIVADKLYDFIQNHYQNVIVDTTFADYNKSLSNIKRAIDRKRKVGIVYLYQDPIIAWKFTKIREIEEGRPIPKEFFIESYFGAKKNVNKAKELYGDKVTLIVVEKNFLNESGKTYINVNKVDNFIKLKYNYKELNELLV